MWITGVSTSKSSDLNLAALLGGVALCLLALLMIVYSVRLWQAARAGDTRIGGDFAAFYAGGTVYRSGGNPYDRAALQQALHSLRPTMPTDHELPFLYPPPFLSLFGLLSRLPYVWAYAALMLISTALYIVTLRLLWREYLPHIPFPWYAAPALLYPPFLHTILDGQLSALACLSLAGFVVGTERKSDAMAGLSLALCVFKPPMLLLPACALLFTRRWRTLLYLSLGCAALVLLSLLMGWQLYVDYLRTLLDYARQTSSGAFRLQFYQYVDFSSQLAAWNIRARFFVLLTGIGLTYLLRRRANYMAAVICLVPIFSIHTASYDGIILIIPLTVLLRERAPGWKWLAATLVLTPLIAAPLAKLTTLQIQKFVILTLCWFISRRPRYFECDDRDAR
ncbi:MAG TPA: glycosyltransferase family 87 protein [Pyrinomonadaceae bacterium]|nr:glycosyltransferase family 87 protein [Pyrinomonadaceae bacterium]